MRLGVFFLVLFLGFAPISARAEAPQAVLEQIAEFRVQFARLRHLQEMGQVTPAEYTRRSSELKNDEARLWKPYRTLPADEQRRAQDILKGMTTARLATLVPQWTKEEQERKKAIEEQTAKVWASVDFAARKALEFQRERLLIQQQLNAGTLSQEAFAQRERAALDGIANIRKVYEANGPSVAGHFDHRLGLLTKALANDPTTYIPERQVLSEATTGPPDFDSDVRLARSIRAKQAEARSKFEKKMMSTDTHRETDVIYHRDVIALERRYEAISPERGAAFRAAIQGRSIAPPSAQPAPSSPGPSTSGQIIVSALLWLAGIASVPAFVCWMIFRSRPEGKMLPPLSDNYGSADWSPIRAQPHSRDDVAHGVAFGMSSGPYAPRESAGAPVVSHPEAHTLIVARTRAGKGTRVIIPTLLRYADSILVIDPKGENAAITARTRRDQLHHAVHIVNPWGEMEGLYRDLGFKAATFNPLDAIDRHDPNAVAAAQSLAATICPAMEGKEKFWQGSAATVLTGVFLWLADQPGEQKTLARAREIVTQTRADFKKLLIKMAASTAFGGAIREAASQYIDLADETYSGIMANLAESTKFLSDPRIKASTASSSFSMRTLRDVLTTVYLVIPHDRIQTHATWLRLVLASAMQGLKSRGQIAPARHRCMFLIDEFGSIGRIDDMPRDIALMSGYGLDFTLVVQGLDQLKDHYGDARGTILSNCGYKWFCFVNDIETAKYLSETLGNKTVQTVGTSDSVGQSAGGGTSGTSTSYGETGRPLLTPDEILNLGRGTAILLHPRGRPCYLRPIDYWNLPTAYAYLKEEYPHFYWGPPLEYDANPYFNKSPPPAAGMSRAEALEILGLKEGADPAAIKAAYRRLMSQIHPDKGGTDYFAVKLNAARDLLLK